MSAESAERAARATRAKERDLDRRLKSACARAERADARIRTLPRVYAVANGGVGTLVDPERVRARLAADAADEVRSQHTGPHTTAFAW